MTQQSMDDARGMAALRSAASALGVAELEYWLFGGWAVDLWVGRPTRPHDDMMLAIKGSPRPDEVGGAKDRADLAALRSVIGDS